MCTALVGNCRALGSDWWEVCDEALARDRRDNKKERERVAELESARSWSGNVATGTVTISNIAAVILIETSTLILLTTRLATIVTALKQNGSLLRGVNAYICYLFDPALRYTD